MLKTFEITPGVKYVLKRDDEFYWLLDHQNLPVTESERKSFWLSFFEQRDMEFPDLQPGERHEFVMRSSPD